MRWTAEDGSCHLITRRVGLMRSVGHDLLLRVGRFGIQVDVDGLGVEARFYVDSIEVEGALVGDHVDKGVIGHGDRDRIRRQIRQDVLDGRRHPEILYRGSLAQPYEGGSVRLEGMITIRGVTRPLVATGQVEGDRLVVRVTIRHTDFGIPPVRAMLGALRVSADVEIEISVPRPA